MGRIFIWAGQGCSLAGIVDPNILLKMPQQIAGELKLQHFSVEEVPLQLTLPGAIDWINARAQRGDIALALDTDAFSNANVRGTRIFHIANNPVRQTQAEQLMRSLMEQGRFLVNRGVHPDTVTATGSLAFTRQVTIPSLVLRLGFVTNPDDRAMLLERPYQLTQGIVNGLALWCRHLAERATAGYFPPIQVSLNGNVDGEQGILVEGNAYVPADVTDQAAIEVTHLATVRWLNYGGISYIRAIDLREAGVCVEWDAETKTLRLQTQQDFQPEEFGKIIGPGHLPASDYEAFLEQINPDGLQRLPDIAQLYQEEAEIEGVNPDVAFAQALLEVNFFGFSSLLQPEQNNFGGLGAMGGSRESACFPSARLGVRAHIQHLKAYANQEPLVQDVVDPRFSCVTRGVAPRVEQLSRRWSAEAQYGENILAILRRLYGSVGLL